jgi:hypothetical protein
MALTVCRASIRITSRELRPDDISAALGIPPTEAFEAGSPVGSRSTRVYEHSVWVLESGVSPDRPLADHLRALLAQIQDGSALQKVSDRCDIDWVCFLSITDGQGAAGLPVDVLQRLAAVPAGLVLDLYDD